MVVGILVLSVVGLSWDVEGVVCAIILSDDIEFVRAELIFSHKIL